MSDFRDLLAKLADDETTGQICESCGCDMSAPAQAEPVIALSDILKLAGLASDMAMSAPAPKTEVDTVHPDGTCTCPHCGNVHQAADMMAAEMEEAAKPDYIDLDKDGDTKETMKSAAQDAEEMDEGEDVCPACGQSPCQCESEVKEGSAFMQAYRALSQGK